MQRSSQVAARGTSAPDPGLCASLDGEGSQKKLRNTQCLWMVEMYIWHVLLLPTSRSAAERSPLFPPCTGLDRCQ